MNNMKEARELTNAKPPFRNKLPRHPQDILHGLASHYLDYYGREKVMSDDGIQAIIKIISNYKRMPKKSIQAKEMDAYYNQTEQMIHDMKHNGTTQDEIMTFIIDRAIGKKQQQN